jgi:hypothetical protein
MNEIQIIHNQLATEQAHFAEVANICAAALEHGKLTSKGNLAAVCADYFAFAITRLPEIPTSPLADGSETRWRDFLKVFNEQAARHFAAIDDLLTRHLPVTEWRTRFGIDADSIMVERTRYTRVKAAVQ